MCGESAVQIQANEGQTDTFLEISGRGESSAGYGRRSTVLQVE